MPVAKVVLASPLRKHITHDAETTYGRSSYNRGTVLEKEVNGVARALGCVIEHPRQILGQDEMQGGAHRP